VNACIAPFRRGSLDLGMKATRTSPNAFLKQSFMDDGRVPVGGDLPHGHAHRSRLDPTFSCPRESFVRVWGWHRGMRDCLVMVSGRGGAPQLAVEELVGALGNVVMTTSCVCALAASHNNALG